MVDELKLKCKSCGSEKIIIVIRESRVRVNTERAIGYKEGEVTYIKREKVYVCDSCCTEQSYKPMLD